MKIPSRRFDLHAQIAIQPATVDAREWHAHVMKHPFGLGAIYDLLPQAGSRSWTREGWNTVAPPVVTGEQRRSLAREIVSLVVAGSRCHAQRLGHEEYNGLAPHSDIPCRECPQALLDACGQIVGSVSVGYASWVDRHLGALEDGVVVEPAELVQRITRAAARRSALPEAVLSTGMLSNGHTGLRISGANGVRSELYGTKGYPFRWRTTYRSVPKGPNDQASFLLRLLVRHPKAVLSGVTLVERRWWKENDQ